MIGPLPSPFAELAAHVLNPRKEVSDDQAELGLAVSPALSGIAQTPAGSVLHPDPAEQSDSHDTISARIRQRVADHDATCGGAE